MAYSMALKEHKRTRRMWFAFPDFNIKVGGATREVVERNAVEQLQALLTLNFLAGRQPQVPKSMKLLKDEYPELEKWEWHTAYIDVAHFFLPPKTSDDQLRLSL